MTAKQTKQETRRPTKRDRLEAREQAILSAARAAFIQHGFSGTSMRLIAETADVAEGTLYLYFKNKNDIVRAVVDAHWRNITEDAKAALSALRGSQGVFERLETLARYHLDMMVRDWPLIELSYVLLYTESKVAIGAVDLKRNYTANFDRVIERARDRGEISPSPDTPFLRDLFYGTLEYAARTLVLHDLAEQSENVVTDLMNVLKTTLDKDSLPPENKTDPANKLLKRLERVTRKLEKLG